MVLFLAVVQLLASRRSSQRRCGPRVREPNEQTCLCVAGALGPGVPHIINTKLLKHFTCLTYNNGRSGLGFGASACKGESRAGLGGRPWSVDWLLRPQTLLRRAPAALCRGLGSSPLRKPYILSALSPLETLTLGALGSPGDFFQGTLPNIPQNPCSAGRQCSRKGQASVMRLGKGPQAVHLAFPALCSECFLL